MAYSTQIRNKLHTAFTARYPSLKAYQCDKAVDAYLAVMMREIAHAITHFGYENGQLAIPINAITTEVNRVRLNSKQEFITTLMHSDESTSLVIIDFKGNIGKMSRISLNPIYRQDIMDELLNLNYELKESRIKELREKANKDIPVNLESLDDFIVKTGLTYVEAEKKPNTKEEYLKQLSDNLMIANQIRAQIFEQDGQFYHPEYYADSDSGRIYGHGLSLQRVSKHVRHAALGRCHKYDFKASSYALLTGLALEIDPTLKVAAIKEYIKNRSSIRKRIAAAVGISEGWAKDIFTSLGFGASMDDNPYKAIGKKLGSTKMAILNANKEFKQIQQAMDLVRDVIVNAFSDEFEFEELNYNNVHPKSDPMKPKKRTADQKLAWIYQAMESSAIGMIGGVLAEEGYEPLLFAHDCIYLKHKLPSRITDNIAYELSKKYPLLVMEHEEVTPIFHKYDHFAEYAEYDAQSAVHKAFMAELERGANMQPDPLDVLTGYFVDEIKGLNERVGLDAGTEIKIPSM